MQSTRQRLFTIRDAVFLEFEHNNEYQEFRKRINLFIRFAEKASWQRIIFDFIVFRKDIKQNKKDSRIKFNDLKLNKLFFTSTILIIRLIVLRSPVAEQSELNLFPCTLKWVHTQMEFAAQVCRKELFLLVTDAEPDLVSIPDITFLANTNKLGIAVVSELGAKGVKSCHTFSEDVHESKRKKMGFYMGDARIKATTLHSFKGWESRAIVIFIGQSVDKKSLPLIYTGLTRLKRHTEGSYLTIVSCANELIPYGKTWPKY